MKKDRSVYQERYDQLLSLGYCVFPQVLSEGLLDAIRGQTEALCTALPAEDNDRHRSQGTMLSAMSFPLLAELIAWRPALAILEGMGFDHATFTDGYIISKFPQSPRLFWHYDWFAWSDPSAYAPKPQQIFFMYYLSDTSVSNGCLRVLPGSHLKHNSVHDFIGNPHEESLARAEDLSHPAFSTRSDEVDVPVNAGDLVIGDARMLHAAHANSSNEWRTVITLWFQPDFPSLPEPVQAQMVKKVHAIPATWPSEAAAKVRALQPVYTGNEIPLKRELYRRPKN